MFFRLMMVTVDGSKPKRYVVSRIFVDIDIDDGRNDVLVIDLSGWRQRTENGRERREVTVVLKGFGKQMDLLLNSLSCLSGDSPSNTTI